MMRFGLWNGWQIERSPWDPDKNPEKSNEQRPGKCSQKLRKESWRPNKRISQEKDPGTILIRYVLSGNRQFFEISFSRFTTRTKNFWTVLQGNPPSIKKKHPKKKKSLKKNPPSDNWKKNHIKNSLRKNHLIKKLFPKKIPEIIVGNLLTNSKDRKFSITIDNNNNKKKRKWNDIKNKFENMSP